MGLDITPLYPDQGDGSNATSIQGDAVSGAQPTEGQTLVYREATQQYVPETLALNRSVPPAILKNTNFTAEPGKHYSVDTNNAVTTPEVLASCALFGIRFTGTTWNQALTIRFYYSLGYNPGVVGYELDGDLIIYGDELLTLQEIIDNLNTSGIVAAALDTGASGTDVIGSHDGDTVALESGSPESTAFTPVTAALPEPTGSGAVIQFSDAAGSWGDNPLRLDADGYKVNGIVTGIKQIGTPMMLLITLVDVGGDSGWRIYSGASVPDNVTLPTLSGDATEYATLTGSNGAWTNSPTDFAHKWQLSDDGTTGWADIEGATSATYTLLHAQIGKFARRGVRATNASGDSEWAYSLATAAIAELTLSTELVSYWPLLTDAVDIHGDNDLTDNNSVSFSGTAAVLDGSNYLTRADNFGLVAGVSHFSIGFWFKPNSTSGQAHIFNAWELGFVLNLLDGEVYLESASASIGSTTVTASTRYRLLLTYDGAVLRAYVNGVEVSSYSGELADYSSGLGFCASFGAQNGGAVPFHGELDRAWLWGRALSHAEATADYNDGDGVDYGSL